DTRLSTVKDKAVALIQSGFTAGDGYAEVWIRDYNTFITLASTIHDPEAIKENLRVFFRLQGEDGNIVDGFVPKKKAESADVGYQCMYKELAPDHAGHNCMVEIDKESSSLHAVYKYIMTIGDYLFLVMQIAGISVNMSLSLSLEFLMNHRYNKEYGLL